MNDRRIRNWRPPVLGSLALLFLMSAPHTMAYPPAVGILSSSRNYLSCHTSEGPWKDSTSLILDILDKSSGKSLKQGDGTFLISAGRGELKTVVTVIGWKDAKEELSPYRKAWIYVDPQRIPDPSSLNKFAPGWTVNLPASCRIVGDSVDACAGAKLTVMPMTLRAGDDASDAEIELQLMLTRGDSVKGDPKKGMAGNYFARRVRLKVE